MGNALQSQTQVKLELSLSPLPTALTLEAECEPLAPKGPLSQQSLTWAAVNLEADRSLGGLHLNAVQRAVE